MNETRRPYMVAGGFSQRLEKRVGECVNMANSNMITTLGPDWFDELIADREEETLHLEFKTLTHDGGQLKKEDKKIIAEAVSGLANAEGGRLIIGIVTEKPDRVDVACGKRLIKPLGRTTNLVRSFVSDMLSPQHAGITTVPVEEREKVDEGFIVIDVPQSLDRPHYSNTHHQYFRRGSDRTRVMEHGEIRDLMFAIRQGDLEVRTSVQSQASSGNRIGFGFLLSLGNIGRVPVRAPYLKVSPAGWSPPRSAVLDVRLLRGNTQGFYGKTDHLVHVEDEFHMAVKPTGIEFRITGLPGYKDRVSKILQTKDQDLFNIRPFEESGVADRLLGPFQVTFGAENVPPKTEKFDLSKWDMFEIVAQSILNET